jgi:kinetochore protein NDC80
LHITAKIDYLLETLIDETQREKNELQEIVDSQELSPVDVDRMNAERDQLNKNLESFSEKIEEINKVIWEREIHCQKKGDEVSALAIFPLLALIMFF